MGSQTCRMTLTLTLCAVAVGRMGDVRAQTAPPAAQPQATTTADKPSSPLLAKFQSAAKAAQASAVGERAAAIVTLREIAADPSTLPALRHEALFRIAQARELDKAHPSLTLDAYRQALASQPGGAHVSAIELRIAALLAGQNDTRGARQILEPLAERLEPFPREMQSEVLTQLAAALAKDGDAAGSAACTVRMIDKGLAANEAQEIQLYLKAASALVAAGESANAVAVAEKLLARTPPLAHANYKTILLWLVQQHLTAANPDGAVTALRSALDRHNDIPAADTLDLRLRIATILRTGKNDPAAAEKECQAILQAVKVLPAASRGAFKNVYDGAMKELATLHLETGKADALVALVVEAMDDASASPAAVFAMIAVAQPVAATNDVAAGRLLDAARRCVVRNPANAALGDACQQAAVALLLAKPDKSAEALQEARVLYRTAQPAKLLDATDLVVHAFKRVDRNLARANAFLRYQRHGAAGVDGKLGTADDLTDPLAALPAIPADAVRNQAYADALVNSGRDWAGWLARARLLSYMDRSPEAFNALVQAFACCPPQETALQSIADELTTLVMRVTRDADLGQQVIDYMMNGAAGADGKDNTEDDVGDVFERVAKRLSAIHDAPPQTAQHVTAKPPAGD